jgi:GAF domain-containing protein/methyl-accepting chemotaxis protein
MKEHSVKYQSQNLTSLRFRLAISFAVIGILASAIAMFLSYLQSRNNLFEEKQDKLTAIVANAALQIDGDQHALLNTPADMESDAYRELQQKGFAIAATDTEILYVYTMRKDETGSIYFVLDAGHEPGGTPQEYEPSEIGLAYESPTDLLSDNFETMSDPIVEPDFYTDEFGTYLTAYAPFYRSDGSLEGVVGIDILAQNVVAQQVEFIETFLLLFVLSAAGSAVLGWLAGSFIARPVLRLSEAVMNIRDVSEKLEIKTGIREVNLLADNFNKMFDALRANEERLQEQTARLDSQNEQLQNSLRQLNKRANQFKAISQAVRGTISNESLDTLLPRLTTLISEQFGFYHAGIFLLDEGRKFAVLRAANSEGGKRMLARGHKLQVGQTGMVGYVSAIGTPRIALDVGDDAVYFDNPDLPNTRSEMALPLRVADEIIGVLDVQSIVSNAFQGDDVEILSTLADQVAIAIQNSRTYQKMQELLEKAQRTSSAYLQNAWQALQSEEMMLGYQVSGEKVKQLTRPLNSVQATKAVREKATVTESGRNATLAVPIRLRDKVIGMVDIRSPAEHEWDEDEVDIAEAVADRLSLTLETSLLIKATQRRAAKEAKIGEVSARIGASINMRNVLQTAVEELGRALPGSEVVIQFESPDGERNE